MKRRVLIFLLVRALQSARIAQLGSGIVYDPTTTRTRCCAIPSCSTPAATSEDLRKVLSQYNLASPCRSRAEHACPLPRRVFAMEERDLAETSEYRILISDQLRPLPTSTRLLGPQPNCRSTARTTCPAWTLVNLDAVQIPVRLRPNCRRRQP